MKIRVERDVFAEATGWVLRCVSQRATLPVLGGVLIEAIKAGLRFAGTDLELAGEWTGEAAVDEEGRVVLPGRVLGEIARSLPDGSVRLEAAGGQARVSCGAAEFKLRGLPIEDFPALAIPTDAPGGSAAADAFVRAAGQVVRAASHDDARPVLTGTLFEADASKLTLVSTDSYRLAVCEIPWKGPKESVRRVVPSRALQESSRSGEGGGEVSIRLGESQALFESPGRRLTSRLIEGEFPNWRQLVPDELPHRLHLDREAFAEAVRRVGILAQSGAPVRLELGTDGVRLTAGTQDLGEAAEHVEGKFEGEPLTIAFNPQYLLDGVLGVTGTEVVLAARDPIKPAVLRAPEDASFTYLVMPVRIS
jgi:DNA polymerase III subunit beta